MILLQGIEQQYLEEAEKSQDEFIDFLLDLILPELVLKIIMQKLSINRKEAIEEIKKLDDEIKEADQLEIVTDLNLLKNKK
jgi:hypothetical protein